MGVYLAVWWLLVGEIYIDRPPQVSLPVISALTCQFAYFLSSFQWSFLFCSFTLVWSLFYPISSHTFSPWFWREIYCQENDVHAINLWFLLLLLLIYALGPWASWEGSPIPRMTRQGYSFSTRGMVEAMKSSIACGTIQIL